MRVELSAEALEQLMRPVRGRGGWQSLVRRLQRKVDGNFVELTEDDQAQILNYLLSYGTGGWQERLAGLVGAPHAGRKKRRARSRPHATSA